MLASVLCISTSEKDPNGTILILLLDTVKQYILYSTIITGVIPTKSLKVLKIYYCLATLWYWQFVRWIHLFHVVNVSPLLRRHSLMN